MIIPLTSSAAVSPSAYWYVTRGSGVVTLVLLTLTVALGVVTSIGWSTRRTPRFVVAGLHRNLTLLAVVFLVLHVGTTVADGYTAIGLKDAFLPFLSSYRPFWLGLGALSSDLVAALVITSLVRARIGYRTWRGLHWLAYASWPLAVAHSLGTGSDARFGWMAALGLGCTAAVALSVLVRTYYSRGTARLRIGSGVAALMAPLLLLVWYQGGPSQRGWAARAGTPAAILGRHAVPLNLRTPRQRPPGLPAVFAGRLTGRLSQSSPDGAGYVDVRIDAAVHGGIRGTLRLVLRGIPLGGEGVSLASSGVAFAAAGSPAVYEGGIVGLQGGLVLAHLSAPAAGSVELRLALSLDSRSGRVSGHLNGVSSRPAL